MSRGFDKFGRPSNLESPEELVATYRVDSAFVNSRQRLTADRSANFDEAMQMVDVLLHKYQTTYKNHQTDTSLIWMPYLFIRPKNGIQIKNITTGEIYTVKETIENPVTKIWEGLVRLNFKDSNYPKDINSERLQILDDKYLVRFTEEPAVLLGTEGQTTDNIMVEKGPIRPTVTYSLERKEPGSLNGTPFGSPKEYKGRVREHIKDVNDPNHTIEIRGKVFDNIVQFDCCTGDNFSANRLARWFEKFIDLYEWVLRLNGVQQILYWKQFKNTEPKWRQDLVVRSIQYYFRTEEIEGIGRRDLTAIDYYINLNKSIDDTQTRYIAGQLVSGQISQQEYDSLFRDSDGKYLFGNIYRNDGNL